MRDVRDWLYDRMRGSRHEDETDGDTGTEVLEILRDIQSDLAAIRAASARDAGGTRMIYPLIRDFILWVLRCPTGPPEAPRGSAQSVVAFRASPAYLR